MRKLVRDTGEKLSQRQKDPKVATMTRKMAGALVADMDSLGDSMGKVLCGQRQWVGRRGKELSHQATDEEIFWTIRDLLKGGNADAWETLIEWVSGMFGTRGYSAFRGALINALIKYKGDARAFLWSGDIQAMLAAARSKSVELIGATGRRVTQLASTRVPVNMQGTIRMVTLLDPIPVPVNMQGSRPQITDDMDIKQMIKAMNEIFGRDKMTIECGGTAEMNELIRYLQGDNKALMIKAINQCNGTLHHARETFFALQK